MKKIRQTVRVLLGALAFGVPWVVALGPSAGNLATGNAATLTAPQWATDDVPTVPTGG